MVLTCHHSQWQHSRVTNINPHRATRQPCRSSLATKNHPITSKQRPMVARNVRRRGLRQHPRNCNSLKRELLQPMSATFCSNRMTYISIESARRESKRATRRPKLQWHSQISVPGKLARSALSSTPKATLQSGLASGLGLQQAQKLPNGTKVTRLPRPATIPRPWWLIRSKWKKRH